MAYWSFNLYFNITLIFNLINLLLNILDELSQRKWLCDMFNYYPELGIKCSYLIIFLG